jgi:hypothetical protein
VLVAIFTNGDECVKDLEVVVAAFVGERRGVVGEVGHQTAPECEHGHCLRTIP